MYRLLIVDDEQIITDGLFDIFSTLGLELDMYKAYSGQEALQWLQRTRFDIVLSDISMPGMDGLALMEVIRQSWPRCKVIFLTGYNDFEYVYQAIRHPGVKYMLKSEGYPKVIEAVKETIKEVEDELRISDLLQQSKTQSNMIETLAQSNYFRNFLYDAPGNETVGEDFRRLNIRLNPEAPVIVALGSLTLSGGQSSRTYRQEQALAVKMLSDAFFSGQTASVGFIDRYDDLVWLVQPPSSRTHEETVRFLEGMFELILQSCLDSLQMTVAVALAGEPAPWDRIPSVYEKLREQQHYRTGDGTRMIQRVNWFGADHFPDLRERTPRDKAEALTAHLESGREAEFLELFDELAEPVRTGRARAAYVTELYYTIALLLLSHVNRWGLREKIGADGLMQAELYPTWTERFTHLRGAAEAIFSARQHGEQSRASAAIDKICVYIEEHISEDLSLVRLAEVIHFNPSYLSRLFKLERGMNLSEYIEETRLAAAKEMLRSGELKIAEVGAKIGYEAAHSFTRFFKKWTGLTPQDYREGVRT
ncbi:MULTISPECIES: response regulator transcription factor [Paenibacillus]|uniref:response regulator transcription factor n=1 Tax=Paenibacillus TaxID=44249 RepID=UPI0022B8C918|nr:helix-turn-helix domain-containing protein [Paenibacillus caseinilyticus]MCZ8521285.1 response regulator [Paenibacillus caseinilyticus]